MALSDVIANAQYRLGVKPGARALSRGVPRTSEFRRIKALPRRTWEDDPTLDELGRLLEVTYGRDPCGLPLWRTQTAALRDVVEQGGLIGPIPVGGGKAFVSILAPVVYGARLRVERPVLFVPPRLRRQTVDEVIPLLAEHWHLHDDLLVLGSNFLSLAQNAHFLDVRRPGMIVIDEVHEWKNKNAARVRRLGRYVKANPECVIILLSGTITRKSVKDYGHLADWALGEGSPLPRDWRQLETWSCALDPGVADQDALAAGALEDFCEDGDNVRQGFRRRLVQTPGVVAGPERELGVALYIDERRVDVPDEVFRAIEELQRKWETPGGEQISEAAHLWAAARQLSCGFYYKWDPPPPRPWAAARREWKHYVREVLRHNRRGLDSELQVWNECERETKPSVWKAWHDVKDTFKPNSVPVWISDFLVDDVLDWVKEDGIVWTEHVAFGERVSDVTWVSYYGAGTELTDVNGPVVLSIQAHGEGKNLQRWSRNLIVSCPSSGKAWQQLLGRTHREGQEADAVTADVYFHTQVLRDAWDSAVEDAYYLQDTTANRQKILYANRGFEWQ